MESLSGLTAATVDPSGETATADEETAPVRGGGAVEVSDGVGVGSPVGVGVSVAVGAGMAVGVGSRVAVGVCTAVDLRRHSLSVTSNAGPVTMRTSGHKEVTRFDPMDSRSTVKTVLDEFEEVRHVRRCVVVKELKRHSSVVRDQLDAFARCNVD